MADYIDRESLVKYLVGYCEHLSVLCHNNDDIYAEMLGVTKCLDRVESAPKADVVEVRHGEWLDKDGYFPKCSECDTWTDWSNGTAEFNYCPNCGAYMRGGKDGC